ncbi:CvfB family protein [Metabacillus arenae]|uniref:CvfB family protein n=1 Tax=Metabacillus arenae TaxID=2771434 RepID=UPI002964196B|nr:S1 RNA-binding domain-containing protein [Metabacillus arenae]
MKVGTIQTLTIDERADYGYFLTDGENRILLHNSEVTENIEGNETVDVFIYIDHEERMAATMRKPIIDEDHHNWVEVVEVVDHLGAFVNIGLSKDALIASDHLPLFRQLWPQPGDKLLCTMRISKNGKYFAEPLKEEKVRQLVIKAEPALLNKDITGTVYRLIVEGSFLITEDGYKGFIHKSERKQEPRLGEKIQGRVIDVKEDGTLNVSLLPRKQEAIEPDAREILIYMESRGGAMPYWDKSSPDDIKERFGLSKAAFKRALGNLMKHGKVYQENGWTYFKKEE